MPKSPLEQRIMLEYIKQKLQEKKRITVLELGAGTGRFTKLYCDLPGIKIILAEPDSECRKRLTPLKAKIITTKAEDLALDGVADIVVMATAFHHVTYAKKLRALKKIREALKPDGWFLCGDNFLAPYDSEAERALVLRKSVNKWIRDAKKSADKDDLAVAQQMKILVARGDFGGECFVSPQEFEALAVKARFVVAGKANCTLTHPLDLEHHFFLLHR